MNTAWQQVKIVPVNPAAHGRKVLSAAPVCFLDDETRVDLIGVPGCAGTLMSTAPALKLSEVLEHLPNE